eukprot:TRINITY_DN124_c0_g1_i1.p2 TRINITY_DN124_c0_g1~~TRINITY_DN124_c0_g1_i1.p2  ORF type:complete len:336 (-),score=85.48 TRINITY_DN124_c0_g1_i1:42-1049(-)
MSFLFGKKAKSPPDLVRLTKEALLVVSSGEGTKKKKDYEKAVEEISKYIIAMKNILYGEGEADPSPDLVTQLANEVYSNDLLSLFINNLSYLEFEARKDVASVYNNLLRRKIGTREPTVEYLARNTHILQTLLQGYESQGIALPCGSMARESLKHETLAAAIFTQPDIAFKLFTFVELSTFDLASDAFATFKDLLTRHKKLVSEFVDANYDSFFEKYTELLKSSNFVTRRQSLKLLGELLLERANYTIMTKYISDQTNLRLVMTLLRDKSRSIQYEAFHVFKVFVANPNKPQSVVDILRKNQEKLLVFLQNFHNDKDDDQFNDEKTFLMKQIKDL